MAEKNLVLTGARARFKIQGVKVGYASNVTVGEAIRYENLEVLDNIEVAEKVPIAYDVTFSARRFRALTKSLKKLGWMPKYGGSADARLLNILNAGDMVATIEDPKTDTMWATVQEVKLASVNWSVDARGIVGEDVTFEAIRVLDESELD